MDTKDTSSDRRTNDPAKNPDPITKAPVPTRWGLELALRQAERLPRAALWPPEP